MTDEIGTTSLSPITSEENIQFSNSETRLNQPSKYSFKSKLIYFAISGMLFVVLFVSWFVFRKSKSVDEITSSINSQSATNKNIVSDMIASPTSTLLITPTPTPIGRSIKTITDDTEFFIPEGAIPNSEISISPSNSCSINAPFNAVGHYTEFKFLSRQDPKIIDLNEFRKPITISMNLLDKSKYTKVNPDSLTIYYCNVDNHEFEEPLATKLDWANQKAIAQINKAGIYGIVGKLLCENDEKSYDDDFYQANWINPGSTVNGFIINSKDIDSYTFEAQESRRYLFTIKSINDKLITSLSVSDESFQKIIDSSQQSINGQLVYELKPTSTDNYYFAITAVEGSYTGCDASYEVSLQEIK